MEQKRKEQAEKRQEDGSKGSKRRRTQEADDESTTDEDVDGAVAPINMCDDSSEYSDEVAEELDPEGGYPFAEKPAAVRDLFIYFKLCSLAYPVFFYCIA